ncbi:MAG: sugar phosphate isomerase/epimerase and 4-hydroxyphenylpyruvate domain-containing protein [Rhizobiaceae bacterium]|nr:sugar phosphate isomerase/epimerase and 4-hydroxyphenylpyruvate domain-containing protein [Rhizobiaceae bacterium]
MKTSIATVSISGDLSEKLSAIAEAGFDGIEIFENDFLAFDASPREVGRMVRDAGLEIALFQPFRDFEGMPEPLRGRTFDRAQRKFDLMNELGADLVLVCSNVSPAALGGIDRAAADFRELGELAAQRGIRVGYEALAWGRFVSDHRDAWEIVRRADHPNVGLIVDSFHSLARRIDPDTIATIPGDRIFFVQVADAPALDMDLLYWSRHYRNMPGEGDLPVADFLRAVASTGYDGYLSLEIFNDQFRGGSAKAISVDGKRSLVNLMSAAAETGHAPQLPAMPERAHVRRPVFIEFTANEAEAEILRDTLVLLGFVRVAEHRTKAVTAFRQGEINILINREKTGFAHSFNLVHGLSVCATAFEVDDVSAALERARALAIEPHRGEHGPAELDLPGLYNVGSGVLHLVDSRSGLDRLWEVDFSERPAGDTSLAGLARIDHIGFAMPADEVMSWQLFYTSLFQCEKQPIFDIVDPAGLVRSQVVESADGALRLTLEGATNRRTFAGHFVSDSFAAGVHHVALGTDDIFATAAQLRELGFQPIEISRNYYDDLEARIALDPDLVDRLRADNILYDRDEHGEFFQLYGGTLGQGFFFEIVERRGGYRGYGAANAPFRIAAQRRTLRPKGMPAI